MVDLRSFQPGTQASRSKRLILLILLVLVSFVAAQASVDSNDHHHQHNGPNHHCCPVCHGGYIPVLQTGSLPAISAPPMYAWRFVIDDVVFSSRDCSDFNSSRAPPA